MSQDHNALVVEPLAPAFVRTAYPLLQSADATIDVAGWLRYARAILASNQSRRGVLVARWRRRPNPCGAACWQIDQHPGCGALLTAEYLVVLDPFQPDAVMAALIAALKAIAQTKRCTTVRAALRKAGHRPEFVTYSMSLRE